MMYRLSKDQRGDTIIEVLLAIAVVGIVLAGAYVSANRSLLGTQVSKERVEALQYVRGQMEVLMHRLDQGSAAGIPESNGTSYCYDYSSLDLSNDVCYRGVDNRYKIGITRDTYKYTITAEWEKARGGDGTPERITLNYNASR